MFAVQKQWNIRQDLNSILDLDSQFSDAVDLFECPIKFHDFLSSADFF